MMDGWMFDPHPRFFPQEYIQSQLPLIWLTWALVMRVQRALKGRGSRLLICLVWSSSRSGNWTGFEREHASDSFIRWRLPLESFSLTCNRTPLCSWVRRCRMPPSPFPSSLFSLFPARSLWVDAFHNQRDRKYLWGGFRKFQANAYWMWGD